MNEQSTRMCVNVQTGFGARHIDRFSRSISMRLYSVQCLLLVRDRLILLEAGSRALVCLQAPGSLPSIKRLLSLLSSLTFRASMSIMAIRDITAIRAIMHRGYQAIMAIKADQTKLTGLTGMKV